MSPESEQPIYGYLSNELYFLQKISEFVLVFFISGFLEEAVKAFLSEVPKLFLRQSRVSDYHMVLLTPLLYIVIRELTNLSRCFGTVHTRHIYVHHN